MNSVRVASPRNILARIMDENAQEIKGKVIAMYLLLGTFNVVLWTVTFFASFQYPVLLGTGLLAFTLGLRHGVDADHIAAVDNVTRKLMQDGKRPVGVGLFFSLGHSTVVFTITFILALTATLITKSMPGLADIGGLVGTTVSALFLYVIGFINLLVLVDIYRMFRRVTQGGTYNEETLEQFLAQRGFMNRFFGPLVRAINTSWKMYPLGFLFGLGFDTATQVGLLGVSASTSGKGMPLFLVMLLPLLFAAGMSLVDTTDSIMMLGAYGWAFVRPVRKLYYNMNITFVSVLVAVVVGTVEFMSILANRLNLTGWLWDWVAELNFENIGYLIVGIFLASWIGSTLIYKVKKYDAIEAEVEA